MLVVQPVKTRFLTPRDLRVASRAVSKKPAPEKGLSKGKAAKIVYKVKKGDTLGKIARKYQTQVSVLLELNHMKLRDNLYVDREIRLPNQTQ